MAGYGRMRTMTVAALVVVMAALGNEALAAQGLATRLDSLARDHAAAERVAGVSVAVVHRGDTLLMAGYGMADLEWAIPTPADGDAVYEIGSITKQFTAAAILQLAEAGALDLDADFRRYLPDYDTGGHVIPVRRLLDHTSGIKGYTEMPVFGELMARDLPRDTLVALFAAEPLEFEPGAALIYNNSAYFLLGLIIEAVSGRSYEEYVREHLFEPLGMTRSSYCDEAALVDRKAHGYDVSPEGMRHKRYLDHLWPYAAGSLCSTVGDLVRWNRALHGGEVLRPPSYRTMTTPRPLLDGSPVRYAMGLAVLEQGGRRLIAHGGGINGFLSDGLWFPDEELLVVVLQNTAGPVGPGALAGRIVEAVLGPPEPPVTAEWQGDLAPYAGRYRGPARGRALTLEVTVHEGALRVAPADASEEPELLTYRGDGTWGAGSSLFRFVGGGNGMVALHMDQGFGYYVLERVPG